MPGLKTFTFLLALEICGVETLATRLAHSQQFMAEVMGTNLSGQVVIENAQLYVADQRVRIETSDFPESYLLVDVTIPDAYLVRPAQRIYLKSKQSSQLTRLFVPLDPTDPCSQWQTMAEVSGITDGGEWRCVIDGSEVLDGRSAVKFTITSRRGRSVGWIDPHLKFPIKIETEDGTVLALRNIQETPQAVDKFVIPPDFRQYDPHQIIELLKHTDIWVEPPR